MLKIRIFGFDDESLQELREELGPVEFRKTLGELSQRVAEAIQEILINKGFPTLAQKIFGDADGVLGPLLALESVEKGRGKSKAKNTRGLPVSGNNVVRFSSRSVPGKPLNAEGKISQMIDDSQDPLEMERKL